MESITEAAANDPLPDPPRRRNRRSPPVVMDRLPPHSHEAEQGVLGCIMLSPNGCISDSEKVLGREGDAFYDLRHQTIYTQIISMHDRRVPIDAITLQQALKDRQLLEQVGGIAYLAALPDTVASAANLSYYLEIVLEKHGLRKMIHMCTEVVGRIYDFEGEVAPLMAQAQADLVSVMAPLRQSVLQEHWSMQDLLGYDVQNDPNAVIGWHEGKATRYLCRGYSAWIIAQAGIGKSSLAQQQAYRWALGKPFCGIYPARTGLRILIVQNENDLGDASEATQGIVEGSEFTPKEVDALMAQTKTIRCRGLTGSDFCRWLEREVVAFQADIVYVDPLLRYAGIDVSRQDQCTKFLNNDLDPVLARTGVVMVGIHHTGKPKSKRETEGWTIYDFAYSGIGSSELVNWARAISIVTPEKGGHFHMMLAKRGSRAWATHPGVDDQMTTSIYLKHAQGRILWEQIHEPPPPEKKERATGKTGRPNKIEEIATSNLHDFCAACKPEGEGLNEASRRLMVLLAKNKIDASLNTCKRVIPALVSNGKLTKNVRDDDTISYTKGPNS